MSRVHVAFCFHFKKQKRFDFPNDIWIPTWISLPPATAIVLVDYWWIALCILWRNEVKQMA